MKRDLWMSNVGWYDPKLHYANFIVLDSQPGNFSPLGAAGPRPEVFRQPGPDLPHRPYTIMVWNRNLLNSIPR